MAYCLCTNRWSCGESMCKFGTATRRALNSCRLCSSGGQKMWIFLKCIISSIIIIIIINFIVISFIQGICTYIPETNYVPREYSVAAILLLLFMVLISLVSVSNLLYFYISTYRSMCAVLNMAVFCSSLTSCPPGMLLTYFLNDWNSPSRPCYYCYLLCFYIPHALYFYCKVFIF